MKEIKLEPVYLKQSYDHLIIESTNKKVIFSACVDQAGNTFTISKKDLIAFLK